MNWFQRHLNWTIVFGFFGCGLVEVLIVALSPGGWSTFGSIDDLFGVLFLAIIFWIVSTTIPAILITIEGTAPVFVSYFLIPAMLFLLICGWVLKRKKRSLALLFLPTLIPLGWILPLCLRNRSEHVKSESGKIDEKPEVTIGQGVGCLFFLFGIGIVGLAVEQLAGWREWLGVTVGVSIFIVGMLLSQEYEDNKHLVSSNRDLRDRIQELEDRIRELEEYKRENENGYLKDKYNAIPSLRSYVTESIDRMLKTSRKKTEEDLNELEHDMDEFAEAIRQTIQPASNGVFPLRDSDLLAVRNSHNSNKNIVKIIDDMLEERKAVIRRK